MIDTEIERIHKTEVYRRAAHKYGVENQLTMVIEECSELIKAICKLKRGQTPMAVIEEMADVEIMIEQIKFIWDCEDNVEKIKREKIKRLDDN